MLPEFLTWNVKPWATPVPAILVQGALTMVFVNFSFGSLVVLGTLMCTVQARTRVLLSPRFVGENVAASRPPQPRFVVHVGPITSATVQPLDNEGSKGG